MIEFFKGAHYDFLGWRKKAYVASGIFIVALLAVSLYHRATTGTFFNYGVDFLGGSLYFADQHGITSTLYRMQQ